MAMTNLSFDDLITIYRKLALNAAGTEGSLLIADDETLALVRALDDDSPTSGIHSLIDLDDIRPGTQVTLEVSKPKLSLGALARDFNELLLYPRARFKELSDYFIQDGELERTSVPVAEIQVRYRLCLKLIAILIQAASYFDENREELVFVGNVKTVVPIKYDAQVLEQMNIRQVAALIDVFQGEIHLDQKLSLLAESISRLSAAQPLEGRFQYLLQNAEVIVEDVRQGYRLFASSFSYAKVRNEIETARVEYLGKIHKTIVDIQNQLLGIPVATVIVASQLKDAPACGPAFYANWAIVGGAWIFLALLAVAIINQWLTLSALRSEIGNQREKLRQQYAGISADFVSKFDGLVRRIAWHQGGLLIVLVIAFTGALFATLIFNEVTKSALGACLGS